MKDKVARGNASQFFIAGELCRRGLYAVVTLGNTPNTDILCSNKDGTAFAHIQVKTFVPGNRSIAMSSKAELDYGPNFFWIFGGIPLPDSSDPFEYYVVPSGVLSKQVKAHHQMWLSGLRRDGKARLDGNMRTVLLPPRVSLKGWSVAEYRDRWDLIESALR